MRAESKRSCLACGCDLSERIGPTLGGFYDRCLKCGLESLVTEQSAAETFDDAQESYHRDAAAFEAPHIRRFTGELAVLRLRRIRKHLQTGRILEVGPGGGELLSQLLGTGYDVQAVEHSPELAERLRVKLGVPIAQGAFESVELPLAGFDAVISMHVIEHVPDPLAHLRRAFELVRPGGYLFLATPNAGGWPHQLTGRRWCGYSNAHLSVFTPRSMTICLQKTGWRQEALHTIESVYSWPRCLMNLLRTRDQACPERPARGTGGAVHNAFPRLMGAMADVYGVVSWPARAAQAALRGGDELFVIARRADSNDLA